MTVKADFHLRVFHTPLVHARKKLNVNYAEH